MIRDRGLRSVKSSSLAKVAPPQRRTGVRVVTNNRNLGMSGGSLADGDIGPATAHYGASFECPGLFVVGS